MMKDDAQDKAQLVKNALPIGTALQGSKQTYQIERVLGAGGFGITYRAYTKTMDGNIGRKNFYAIKEHFMKGCYRGEDTTSVLCPLTIKNDIDQSREDFENEAKILTKLCRLSEHIVKVNETFKANGTIYYVMEYLSGGDLADLVRRNKNPLSEAVALSLLIPIAKAVSLLHSGEPRFLHLDIKPDNIVMKMDEFTGASYAVLIDFGTAKQFNKKGEVDTLPIAKGATEGYAPIEQHAEINEFDARLDVYALGATLFYLLTGKPPIKAWDISAQYIMDALPSGVSERTRNAIKHAMQKDKVYRTASVDLFLQEISDIYTLRLYSELQSPNQKYLITEILSEDNYSITYKAIVSHSIHTSQENIISGKATVANEHYILCECYSQQFHKRAASGYVTWVDKQKDQSLCSGQFKHEAYLKLGMGNDSNRASSSMDLTNSETVLDKDEAIRGEVFEANGTMYYCTKVTRPISIWAKMRNWGKTARGIRVKPYVGGIAVAVILLVVIGIKSIIRSSPDLDEDVENNLLQNSNAVLDYDVKRPEQINILNSEEEQNEEVAYNSDSDWIEKYDAGKAVADNYFSNKKYENARLEYEKIRELIPDSDNSDKRSWVIEKIADCKREIVEDKEIKEREMMEIRNRLSLYDSNFKEIFGKYILTSKKENKKWGVIDSKGYEKIPFQYDRSKKVGKYEAFYNGSSKTWDVYDYSCQLIESNLSSTDKY